MVYFRKYEAIPIGIKLHDNHDNSISALEIYRKYALLRPKNMNHRRFFLQYKNNRCTVQPVGKNTFGTILQLC
jgi:hypothetical protein